MDWEDRLDDWDVELELHAQLEGSDWVTLERAAADTGVSRAALRSWYRTNRSRPGWSRARTGRSGWCRSPSSPAGPRPRRDCAAPPSGAWPKPPSWRSSGTA